MNINQELHTITKKWAGLISSLNGDISNDREIATRIVATFGPMSKELSDAMQSNEKYMLVHEVLELAADLEWQEYATTLELKNDWDRLIKMIADLSKNGD